MTLSRWRLAARLARREVGHRPGRTALVAALVAIPTMAMTVASVMAHTTADTWAEDFVRANGNADIAGLLEPGRVVDRVMIEAGLPVGSQVQMVHRADATVRGVGVRADVVFTDFPVESDLTTGVMSLRSGRVPSTGSEVALDPGTAGRLGVRVGDTLTLTEPAGQWVVTGIVRQENQWDYPLMVLGTFDWSRLSPEFDTLWIHVDLPVDVSLEQTLAALGELNHYGHFEAREITPWFDYLPDGSVSAGAMAWGWVVGALALCVLGIIIASAFATSARRQLVTLGQLSANGADQGLMRRSLAVQGSWSGLLGATVGIVLGLAGLAVGRGPVEAIVRRGLGAYEVMPSDLLVVALTGTVAATIAALVPARSIVRVPVMAALSGRRPLGSVPRRLVPIGLGMFGSGLFLLVIAASGAAADERSDTNLFAAVAVLGGLGVLFGMCCLSPWAVDMLGRLGDRSAGTWRVTTRSLARTRTRSAGVVTAVAAAGALAIGGAALFAANNAAGGDSIGSEQPANVAFVSASIWSEESASVSDDLGTLTVSPPGYHPVPVPSDVLEEVRRITDGAEIPRRVALWDPAPYEIPAQGSDEGFDRSGVMVVADPAVLDLIGLSAADRGRLAATGMMTLQQGSAYYVGGSGFGVDDRFDVVIEPTGRGPIRVAVAVQLDPIASVAGVRSLIVTPERAVELGLEFAFDGVYFQAESALDDRQLDALRLVQNDQWNTTRIFDVPADMGDHDPADGLLQVSISPSYGATGPVWGEHLNLIVALAALLFTLLVVAVGLALSAAESRHERDVLVAIGAKPGALHVVSGQKAAVLSLLGAVLAVPTGLLPVEVVLRSVRDNPMELPLNVPWVVVISLTIAVPLLAGLLTWLGSVVAHCVRPVRMSTLALD